MDWIQIRHNILSGLFWVQTVCKSYQEMTLGDEELILLSIFSSNITVANHFYIVPCQAYISVNEE